MITEREKLDRLIRKEKPSGINCTTLVYKPSPKSKEAGIIHNKKIISIFMNCSKIKHTKIRIKTYQLLKRLVNKKTLELNTTNGLSKIKKQ